MPANKNALIRYKTIDNCLRNPYRRWTLEDLVEACSEALYEAEGICKGVSVRTVQGDLHIMRSNKLGYNAPIEVYEHKYYRYADRNFSIMKMPLSQNDLDVMQEAVDMLRELENFEQFAEMSDVVRRLQEKLSINRNHRKPLINFDSVSTLKGLQLLNPLYNYIANRQTLRIIYQSFKATTPTEYVLFPYLLKEWRNRWFLYGSTAGNLTLYNLPLDRILSVEPVDVPYMDNERFDTEHFFDDIIGVSKNINDRARKVLFWADAVQTRYIKTKPIHSSQRVINENPDDHTCVFRIDVVMNFEMYSVFMSYGPGIKILYPRNAVNFMENSIRQMVRLYADPTINKHNRTISNNEKK